MATHFSILAWRILVGYSPWGRKELDTTEWLHFTSNLGFDLYKLCGLQEVTRKEVNEIMVIKHPAQGWSLIIIIFGTVTLHKSLSLLDSGSDALSGSLTPPEAKSRPRSPPASSHSEGSPVRERPVNSWLVLMAGSGSCSRVQCGH